jgi:hypothetical protein
MLQRLEADPLWAREYGDFVAAVSFVGLGAWNEIHAAPLVLTTVRPAVTYRNFSESTTEALLIYGDPYMRCPELEVYWKPKDEFS